MTWIKRNLFFVIGAAIGLALTGYCGFLLYGSMNANAGVAGEFNDTLNNLQSMQQTAPYPSQDNIQAAKADQERVRAFLADFRKSFAPFPTPPAEDQKGFKTYLEDTLVRFRAGATNAGVELPADFNFTFSGLMGKLTYPPENIAPWMEQLQEISMILDILYHAKINYLASLCRVPVSADDVGTGDCMLPTTSVTNEWGVVTPYKITFRGFSTEIAAVLEGFARSSNCFIVKAIDVVSDKSAISTANSMSAAPQTTSRTIYVPQPAMPNPMQAPTGRDRGMPGIGRRMPMPVAPTPMAPVTITVPAAPSGPLTILSESPLLVTISVDAVKLKASEH